MAIADTKRLVTKQVSLGTLREKEEPNEYIGLREIAPFKDVETDDVIFDYIRNHGQETLAPARAEDAESRLRQHDDFLYGTGRASLIDWAFKDKYAASDVTRYFDNLQLAQSSVGMQLTSNPPMSAAQQFAARVARDDASRKRSLDARLEWLITQAIDLGSITYNDGHIIFSVNFGRPADQHQQVVTPYWDAGVDHDPIQNIKDALKVLDDRYGVKPTRAYISQDALDTIWKSKYFIATIPGFPIVGGTPNVDLRPEYLNPGWTQDAAISVVERATGVKFRVYDGFYTTRPTGSTVMTKNRFTSRRDIIFLPNEGDLGEIDDTEIGFAKTLTAPHPEGDWTPGFYEWEQDEVDPWMHVRGYGIKAFPIFPYMKYTFSLRVLSA